MRKKVGTLPEPRRTRIGLILVSAALLTAVGIGSGCATPPRQTAEEKAVSAARVDQPEVPDKLQQGDMLKIKFHFHPELNEEQPIRRDGKIAMQLVGEVQAEGLTPAQLGEELSRLYGAKIRHPEINVSVRSYKSPRVFVGGEVRNPGVKMIEGRLTALGAIMQAGGLINRSADPSRVVVVRNLQGSRNIIVLDLRHELEATMDEVGAQGEKPEGSFSLRPYDVVYVPRTNIDVINQWISQHIDEIVPGNFGISLTHEID